MKGDVTIETPDMLGPGKTENAAVAGESTTDPTSGFHQVPSVQSVLEEEQRGGPRHGTLHTETESDAIDHGSNQCPESDLSAGKPSVKAVSRTSGETKGIQPFSDHLEDDAKNDHGEIRKLFRVKANTRGHKIALSKAKGVDNIRTCVIEGECFPGNNSVALSDVTGNKSHGAKKEKKSVETIETNDTSTNTEGMVQPEWSTKEAMSNSPIGVRTYKRRRNPNPTKHKQHQHPCPHEGCRKSFRHMASLLYHRKLRHNDNVVVEEFKCDPCQVVYQKYSNLERHMQVIHSEEIGAICNICGKQFKMAYYLKQHMRKHDHKTYKKHACPICGKTFLQKNYVAMHIRIHTGEKPYMCETCGKQFTQESSYRKHMTLVHTEERPYECDVCKKRYKLKEHLVRHRSSHGATFPSAASVRDMRRVDIAGSNTKAKHFCQVCDKTFKNSFLFRKHSATVHKIRTRGAPKEGHDDEIDFDVTSGTQPECSQLVTADRSVALKIPSDSAPSTSRSYVSLLTGKRQTEVRTGDLDLSVSGCNRKHNETVTMSYGRTDRVGLKETEMASKPNVDYCKEPKVSIQSLKSQGLKVGMPTGDSVVQPSDIPESDVKYEVKGKGESEWVDDQKSNSCDGPKVIVADSDLSIVPKAGFSDTEIHVSSMSGQATYTGEIPLTIVPEHGPKTGSNAPEVLGSQLMDVSGVQYLVVSQEGEGQNAREGPSEGDLGVGRVEQDVVYMVIVEGQNDDVSPTS